MMICETCGKVREKAFWSRGYWWCPQCASVFEVDGVLCVDFPSAGKMIPDTIMTVWEEA